MNFLQKSLKVLANRNVVFAVFVLTAIVAGIQAFMIGGHQFNGVTYKEYNNYIIFKNSFFHLIHKTDLYKLYPAEQWDLFKYSPAFALFMGFFAYLPDLLGLALWNLLNSLVLFVGIGYLPIERKKSISLQWFVLLELLTSLQNSQSNGLLAGLILLSYCHLQRRKPLLASLWIVMATFLKIYGGVAFILFLFFPNKLKFILFSTIWAVAFALLPLLVLSPHELMEQYKSWLQMMQSDRSASFGISVMGWLHSWFGMVNGKELVTAIGFVLFLLPFARFKMYPNQMFQLLILSSLLIWVIIFNHKAESPTFVIAVAGAGLWYFVTQRNKWSTIFIIFLFIFTCMSPTDIFPKVVRDNFLVPYAIKVVPCIVAWLVILFQMLTMKSSSEQAKVIET